MSGEVAYPAFAGIEERIDSIAMDGGSEPACAAAELLAIGERVLEAWVRARGEAPTEASNGGFRLLALHRQGARGEPSFDACRETCRELVYHCNLIALEPDHRDAGHRLTLAAMITRHLMLFVSGKLGLAGLSELYCSPMRLRAAGH
jgi:hypothetical protein